VNARPLVKKKFLLKKRASALEWALINFLYLT
jgi:hypothetical protein